MKMKKTTEIWAMLTATSLIAMLFAVAALAQGASFRFFGPLSRVITPNGDANKNNGTAFFCFDNPADSGVAGNIFSLLGSAVASLGPVTDASASSCPAGFKPQYLTWDGRSNGATVRSGIYVYRITAEQKSYTGTVIVVR